MSSFTLDQCLEECASNKLSRMQVPKGAKKKELFQHIWDAFCAWILEQLRRGKGCSIPIFARVGWEIYTVGRNEKKRRPFFAVTDSFARGNNVQGLGLKPTGESAGAGMSVSTVSMPSAFTSLEEINFTKIAIKFSKNLTKDLVFTGLRDIFHKIGAAISQGRTLKLEFKEIGTLMSKDRRLAFWFDLASVTPNPLYQSTVASPTPSNNLADTGASSAYGDGETVVPLDDSVVVPSEAQKHTSRSSAASAVPLLDLSSARVSEPPGPLEDEHDVEVAKNHEGAALLMQDLMDGTHDKMESYGAMSEDGNVLNASKDSLSLDPNPTRVKVVEDAYHRELANLKEQLSKDEREFEMLDEQHRQREQLAVERRDLIMREKKELQSFIKEQMKLKDKEREQELRDIRNAKNGEFLPLEQSSRQQSREKMKRDLLVSLQDQISEKSERSKSRQEREREEERRFLDHVAYEMDQYKSQKEAINAIQQKELTTAWKRDGFMKKMLAEHRNAMRKSQKSASRKYQTSGDYSSARSNRSLSQNSDYSIGFDMRAKSRQS